MKRKRAPEEEIAEDYCFVCKDGGRLMVCDFKHCLKSYHPECVGKEPSILESEESWICDWHSCFICRKKSVFQCYCCPSSVCRHCLKDAEFVKFKKRTKGFCINCLKIAMLAEENIDVDSDGEKVDFKDIETYEFLFKEYWDIIKDKEGLTLADLQAANAALKRGKHLKAESDSDMLAEEYAGSAASENESDDGILPLVNVKRGRGRPRKHLAMPKSKKRVFLGWGSTELINFLTSVGKDTKEPITQLDANEIIKDYIHKNNLFDPGSKRKNAVLCDDKLYALLGKRKVKYYKLYNILENHFCATDESDEELSISSEEGVHSTRRCKREKKAFENKNLNLHLKNCQKNAFAPPEIRYASIVGKNINAVYLKRSLFVELLKTPDTFDGKVTGCFVRVKLDRNDFEFTPAKMYKVGQVLGVKKSLEMYKINGEMLTDIVLCVSNFHKDVQISRLSEDDFEEEECEELCQLANKGLFKRPTLAEFEKKIISIHADRMNHWIDKEIVRLQRLIDRANDKGWRRELFEYIDQREKLKTSAERQRLLQEIPRVIVDIQPIEGNTQSPITEKKGSLIDLALCIPAVFIASLRSSFFSFVFLPSAAMSFFRHLLLRSLRGGSVTELRRPQLLAAISTPSRHFAFSSAEEAAAERRRRKRRLRIEPPLHALRRDPNAPRPPRDPNAPRLPDSTSALVGPRLNLHNRVQSLIRGGDLDAASSTARHAVFSSVRPTVFTCNAVTASMLRAGRIDDVVALFTFFFNQSNIVPNVVSYNILINAHCNAGRVDVALDVYRHILENAPFSPSYVTYRHLTKGLVDADRMQDAIDLLREMLNRGHGADSMVYNTLMAGFIDRGNMERALQFFDELRDRCLVYDGIVHSTLMEAYFKRGMEKEAMDSYQSLLDRQFKMTPATCNVLIETLLRHDKLAEAEAMFESMLNNHSPPSFTAINTDTYNLMVNQRFKEGKFIEAIETFHRQPKKPVIMDVGCFNNIIGKLCENGLLPEAEKLFAEMPEKSINADATTHRTLIDACFRVGRTDDALEYFAKMIKSSGESPGFRVDVGVYNMMFDGLVKAGRINQAMEVFGKMWERGIRADQSSYEVLVTALCNVGNLDRGRELFEQMLQNRMNATPEFSAFLLNAFGNAGRIQEIEGLVGGSSSNVTSQAQQVAISN